MNQVPDKKRDPLNKLIGKNMLEQPSDQFTASVMNKLGIAPAPAVIRYEPVISRTGWFFIAVLAVLLIFLAMSGTPRGSLDQQAVLVESVLQQGTSFIGQVFASSIMPVLAIGTFAVLILFGAESLYRRSHLKPA
jgi:hypothetical protein